MRKLILALMPLACLSGVAAAQHQQKVADQGVPGVTPWPVTWGADLTVTANLGTLNGAATAANQQREITQLAAIGTRMVTYTDLSGTVPTGSTTTNAVHDAGSPAMFSRVNASAYSAQGGTLIVHGCGDSACAAYVIIQSTTIAAGGSGTVGGPLSTRYWRTAISNASGTTASASVVYSSMTAN